ncbi:MAG: recombinase family protein [Prevotella sp.]|nr:recombinase family protein [Alistipes senegalensis]MCM1358557.1 recombinase family protein [Prevotella sp.]MCM1474391.1 recombinase family protein [Muribaculaceae bacterium]
MTIACYARKSNDVKNDSIENQLSIIRDYISRHQDLQSAEIQQFSDNGASGLDLNRNAFQELLSKVRQREIDVVIVKDLSRLGRNYLDVCKLTDSIFPFMKVRLIAISENYDSKYKKINSMDLSSAFKSVLNEYYAMETSEKIRNSYRQRIKNGEFTGRIAYGYFLKDRYTVAIDEEKAEVVRKIFSLYLEKKKYIDIVKFLNQNQIPTPSSRTSKWVSGTVRGILKNEQYIGKRVSLTHYKDLKTKKNIPNDRSEWYINENAFPPIISREMFEKVQEILPKSKKVSISGSHIMARKIYCAVCGKALHKNKNFYCRSSYQTGEKPCFQGSLKCDILYKDVLEKVKEFISSDIPDNRLQFSFSDIARIESEITLLKEKKAEIFEHLFNGDINQKEFEKKNENISSQIAEKQNELKICRKTVAMNTKYGSERPLDTLKRLYISDELTREHMQFVKRINVFDSEHFEIIMQPDSPLAVLCKNMDIYEEV